MNKSGDQVFLLTLIDFLLQIIFFGIFVYAIYIAANIDTKKDDEEAISKLIAHFGVSTIVELTDELTRLAPAENIRANVTYVNQNGGIDVIQEKLDKLKKHEEGFGKQPCIYELKEGKKIPISIARVVASDTDITFQKETPELKEVLNRIGCTYKEIQSLSLRQFDRKFANINDQYPDCRHTIVFYERTRFTDARDVAEKYFFLIKRK